MDPKLNKVFNLFDKLNTGTITINFIEQKNILQGKILQFAEEDIYRYFVTDDSFNIKVYLNDFEFEISSDLYLLLETQFNFNFHKTVYACEIN